MRVGTGDAIEELVADGLAEDGRAGVEQPLHRVGMLLGRPLSREPFRAAASGTLAGAAASTLRLARQPLQDAGDIAEAPFEVHPGGTNRRLPTYHDVSPEGN
jgi:hypothetical protein